MKKKMKKFFSINFIGSIILALVSIYYSGKVLNDFDIDAGRIMSINYYVLVSGFFLALYTILRNIYIMIIEENIKRYINYLL